MLFCLILTIALNACNQGNREYEVTDTDTLYSGPKFNEHVRNTEALTPEEERLGFKLPDGFEINLYASEPDIGKPININFDAKGRMWVTQSFEYPFAASPGQGKDRITIVEDTDGDGRGDKFTHFSDTLNIPIGIMPVSDGAVAFSIPNVTRFTDRDGDGRADSQQKLLGPFEYRDTHGMVNNFTTGFDGWIYACHGYTNRSTVAGADGDSIHLISGNTIRFLPDGTRVEHHTAGRINPFGLTFDEMGYLYSTDCHTSPMHQMIRGGDYSQWGKEEGMGFAPEMKPFENEATALAGIAYYGDNLFPEAYRGSFFIGDAVSSKVYRNSFSFKGATPIGKREQDFLLSKDPWFRPVDVKLGPDGALYIADFYNSIIGHYEVPLEHPKRDRIKGRIWRVTYKGKGNSKSDFTQLDITGLLTALSGNNIKMRLAAGDELVNRWGTSAAEPVKKLVNQSENNNARAHGLWILQRTGSLSDEMITAIAGDKDALIRLHVMRIIAERKDTTLALRKVIENAVADNDVHVRRAALEVIGRYPDMQAIETLINARKKVPAYDSHTIYTIRLHLRNLLRRGELMQMVADRDWQIEDATVITTVLVGVQTPVAASFLHDYGKKHNFLEEERRKIFTHMARFIPSADVKEMIATGLEKAKQNVQIGYDIYRSLQDGFAQRGGIEPSPMEPWGKQLTADILQQLQGGKVSDEPPVADQYKLALGLAGKYKQRALSPKITAILRDTSNKADVRASALKTMIMFDKENMSLAADILQSEQELPEVKRSVVSILGEFPGSQANQVLGLLKNAAPDLQHPVVMVLAGSPDGRDIIFRKVKNGEFFARTLIEPKVEERMLLNISKSQLATYRQLTESLEPVSEEKQKLISDRISLFKEDISSPDKGHQVFINTCSPCHSLKGNGGQIGPQLDGVGKWGVQPLVEKILDPNRNISETFRTYTIKLKDGKILSGLYRRDEGAVIVFADVAGKEFSVAKGDISEQNASKYSLMPDQFGQLLAPEDFNNLLAFLLSQTN